MGTILSNGGVKAVLKFAESVEQPRKVGVALARNDETLDTEMLGLMHTATETETQVALGYFERRFAVFGWEGLDRLITDHDLSPRVVADLHRAPPPVKSPWTRADALDREVADRILGPEPATATSDIPDDLSQLLLVSRRLREVGRCEFATMLLSFGVDSHECEAEYLEEIAACLEQRTQEEPSASSDRTSIENFQLSSLLKALDQHRDDLGIGRVAKTRVAVLPSPSPRSRLPSSQHLQGHVRGS